MTNKLKEMFTIFFLFKVFILDAFIATLYIQFLSPVIGIAYLIFTALTYAMYFELYRTLDRFIQKHADEIADIVTILTNMSNTDKNIKGDEL